MSDLIKELRQLQEDESYVVGDVPERAADELESLNAHVAVLESDDHEWYLQADHIEKLEAALKDSAEWGTNSLHQVGLLQERIKVLEDVLAASGGLKCPNCDDEGFTPEQDGRGEWYQEQCEFCYTVKDSIFNRAIAAADPSGSSFREGVIAAADATVCPADPESDPDS